MSIKKMKHMFSLDIGDLWKLLVDEAHNQSVRLNKKVSMADVARLALREYFGKKARKI